MYRDAPVRRNNNHSIADTTAMALLATNMARISSATRTRHPPPSPELMRQIMATRAALSQTMPHITPAVTTPINNSNNTTRATTKVSNMEVIPTKRINQASTKGGQGRNRRDRNREAVRNQVISATIKGTSTRTQDASKRHRR